WIERTEHRPVRIRSHLPQIDVARSDKFHSAISEVACTDCETAGQLALDAETELLAVWIHDTGIGIQKNRRREPGLKPKSGDVTRGDRPIPYDILLLRKAPYLRRRRTNAQLGQPGER